MKKRAAVFTKVKNGHQMIQIWYRYYSQFFADEDIYLLDIGGTDGSIADFGCNIIKADTLDYSKKKYLSKSRALSNNFKTELLKKYQYIIYSDYDEIIYHPEGLDTYLASLSTDSISCSGYEIYQTPEETTLDFQRPVLSQRSSWFKWDLYNKPLITKIDFEWGTGFHSIVDRPSPPVDPNLLLIHLHKIDKQRAIELNIGNAVRNLISKNQYISMKNLSSEELSKKIELFNTSAFIPDKIECIAKIQPTTPFLIINTNQTKLFYSYYNCCYCGGLTINCGHQNFFIGKQFEAWWLHPQDQITKIPENLKQTQIF